MKASRCNLTEVVTALFRSREIAVNALDASGTLALFYHRRGHQVDAAMHPVAACATARADDSALHTFGTMQYIAGFRAAPLAAALPLKM